MIFEIILIIEFVHVKSISIILQTRYYKKNLIKIWKKHTYLQSNKINYVILNLSMYYRFYVTVVSFL